MVAHLNNQLRMGESELELGEMGGREGRGRCGGGMCQESCGGGDSAAVGSRESGIVVRCGSVIEAVQGRGA